MAGDFPQMAVAKVAEGEVQRVVVVFLAGRLAPKHSQRPPHARSAGEDLSRAPCEPLPP